MAYLHIIDNRDASIRETAAAREAADRIVLCCESAAEVTAELDRLVAEGRRFNRILFETHGSPGSIVFGRERITGEWIRANWAQRNYSQLAGLEWTRIYFNGCNVADQEVGWRFLEAAATAFLSRGETFGHTSLGLVLPLYSTFTGRVVHLTGSLRKVTKLPGDPVLMRTERGDL